MLNPVIGRVRNSNFLAFIILFTCSFTYKITFCWRTGISKGWQDEIAWERYADSNSFPRTISSYDAGYPTPFLRALSFLLSKITSGDFLVWHLIVISIISASIASLTFSSFLSPRAIFLMAGVLSTYPSFDLLLLHNLSYWTAIPLFVVLTNAISKPQRESRINLVIAVLLTTVSAKPQILLSVFGLIFISILFEPKLRRNFLLISSAIFVLFAAGRISNNSLTIRLDLSSILNYLVTLNSHFSLVFFPLITIVVFALAKALSFDKIVLIYLLMSALAPMFIMSREFRRYIKSRLFLSLFLSFAISTLSLYVFSNSGWSQNNLLLSEVYTSLFSRHYLPIILQVLLVTLLRFQNSRLIQAVLFSVILQNLVMQTLLFHHLFHPV